MVDAESLADIGRRAGLCAVGVCRADPFVETARVLHQRKRAGLHGGMQFTYRNPLRSTDAGRLVPGAASLIVGALEFSGEAPRCPDDGRPYGRVAAYARADHYRALRTALEAVAAALRGAGHRAAVSADENSLVDRAAAYRAAIGWWGKSANILVPGSGSLVVLGAVVTDAEVAGADPDPQPDGCGSCTRCLEGCPTGAIIAPGTVDARRCLAWLVQDTGLFPPDYRVALGDRLYGCDDCADVCPPNQVRVRLQTRRSPRQFQAATSGASPERHEAAESATSEAAPGRGGRGPASGAWAPLLELLDASDEELLAVFGRWYIPRREPRYLRRNALVVLANTGDRDDPAVRGAVDRALAHDDPLVRAHAVWCARRLGLGLDGLHGRDDPLVRAELARRVPQRAAHPAPERTQPRRVTPPEPEGKLPRQVAP